MKRITMGLALMIALLATAGLARAQTTKAADPVASSPAALQLRVNEAMAKGDWATALQLLQMVAKSLVDNPDQLGPVMEQMRLCRRNLAKPPAPATQPVMLSLSANRKPHQRPPDGQILAIPIRELGNFDYDMEKGGDIPDDVLKLDGCKIRTNGFMVPLDQAERIRSFALVPSLFNCCSGGPPQVQHTIVVKAPPGTVLDPYSDELVVEGILHVHEERDGGFIVSIFQMDATSVKVAEK